MSSLCIRDLVAIVEGQLCLGAMPPIGGDLEPIGRIVSDARQVQTGDVFWGMCDPRAKSGQCLEEAFARGASGVVVEGRRVEPWAGKFSITVEDSRWALWQLARTMRRRFSGEVIGITGGVGKSTTRHMLDAVLSQRLEGATCDVGADPDLLPARLAALHELDDYFVVELPASAGEKIEPQSHLCDPRIVVITSLRKSGSVRGSAGVLTDLVHRLPLDSCVVVNGDEPESCRLADQLSCRVIRVGRGSHCDVIASQVRHSGEHLQFDVDDYSFSVRVQGRHFLTAALAAYAVGRWFEIPVREIAAGLSQFETLPGCCEVLPSDGYTVIDDTCATDVSAMLAAWDVLRDFDAAGQRIVVCGDWDPCEQELANAQQLGESLVARCGADGLIAIGNNAAELVAAARQAGLAAGRAVECRDANEAIQRVRTWMDQDDVVLVRGGPEMGSVVKGLLRRRVSAAA